MSGDMTTAQLLAWADKCLGLAADQAEDSQTCERIHDAKQALARVDA